MSRLLFLSDLQLGGGESYGTPTQTRLDDCEDALALVEAIVEDRGVDTVIVCGDVFQHRRPGVDELLVFARFLEALPCEFVLLAGNHDLRGPAHVWSVLDLFGRRGESVHVTPAVKLLKAVDEGPDVALAFLPWAHPGPLRAAREGATPVEQAEAMVRIAGDLAETIDRDLEPLEPGCAFVRLLVTHHALSGFMLPTGLETGALVGEPVLDTGALLEQGWRAIVAGHIHAQGEVFRDHPAGGCAVSVGSPWVQDFGEADGAHGVLLFDAADGERFERVPLPGRRFVTIDLAGGEVGPLPWFDHAGVAGAVVRVRIRCTEEAARDLDLDSIRHALLEAGAHKVHAVTLDVVRNVRARAAAMAEDTAPLDALDSWLEATETSPHEGGRLRDLTRSLLEKE